MSMICKNCMSELPESPTTNFCPYCGAVIAPELVTPTQAASQPGAWTRIWARLLDIWLDSFIVCPLLWLIRSLIWSQESLAELDDSGLGLISLPFILLFDCAVFAVWGTTLGKWLFGIRLVDSYSGDRLTGVRYFYRNCRFYVSGIALGVLSLFTAVWQEWRIRHGRQTSYDAALHCRPILVGRSVIKRAIAVCILVALLALTGYLRYSS